MRYGARAAPQYMGVETLLSRGLQRDVAVLLRGGGRTLIVQGAQRGDDAHASLARGDHLVDVTELSRLVRVQQLLLVLGDQLGAACLNVTALGGQRGQLAAVQDV